MSNLWSVLSPGSTHKVLDFGSGQPAQVSIFGDLITASRRPSLTIDFIGDVVSDQHIQQHQRWDLTAIVGVFTADELVFGGTSGADGFIEVVATPALIITRSGVFTNGETITGQTSGATATITQNAHGRASQTNGSLTVATGTSATTDLVTASHNLNPYIPGHENYGMFTARWPTVPIAGVDLLIGLGHETDSIQVGYSNGVMGLRYIRGGVLDSFTAITAWDDPLDGTGASQITVDLTKFNVWWLRYGYLGAAGIQLWMLSPTMTWQRVHDIQAANTRTTTLFADPNLTLRTSVSKTAAGAVSYTLETGSWNAGSVGPPEKTGSHQTSYVARTVAAGAEVPVCAVRVLRTHGATNIYASAQVRTLSVSTEGNKPVTIRLRRNARLTGGAWADIDARNSHLEQNLTATALASNGFLAQAFAMQKVDTILTDLDTDNYEFHPGDLYVVTAQSTQTTDVSVALRFRED